MRQRLVLIVLLAAAPLPAQENPPLSTDESILHAVSRLTFGPRPKDLEAVHEIGLDAWMERQLAADLPESEALTERMSRLETLGLLPTGFEAFHVEWAKRVSPPERATLPALHALSARELREAIILRALYSKRQTFEVVTDFWRNHFNVDLNKDDVVYTATHYEEAVIRAHALGSFHELLLETARHPAMLVYLDNFLSRRPLPKHELRDLERQVRKRTGSRETASEQIAAIARQSGLNENYARELMELHTLGVDNGYTQKDVVEVARAFTGWTVRYEGAGTGFLYLDDLHDAGPKRLMGKALPEGRRGEGVIEGEAVIKRLASHENTAAFIAGKLCRFLVHDDPDARMVADIAKVFRRSRGDIRETIRAILKHPQFFDRRNFRAKFKTPIEFVISALRATDAIVTSPFAVAATIEQLGMPIYGCEDPTGYSDAAKDWRDPGVMALRWRFACDLASGKVSGFAIPPSFYDGLPEDPLAMMATLTRRIVPGGLAPPTQRVLERVVFQEVAAGRVESAKGRRDLNRSLVGILLGSPEFQQQ